LARCRGHGACIAVECDDGNAIDGDGCSSECRIECVASADEVRAGQVVQLDAQSGHCYKLAREPLVWQDAESACQAWSGHLVAIGNQVEQDFVATLVDQPAQERGLTELWIGANDFDADGNWAWTNGEPFVFSAWADGRPNGRATEHCGELCVPCDATPWRWNDSLCTYAVGYVCERAPRR
jgi:cysteine-rich repeat protein